MDHYEIQLSHLCDGMHVTNVPQPRSVIHKIEQLSSNNVTKLFWIQKMKYMPFTNDTFNKISNRHFNVPSLSYLVLKLSL